jgi:hypothetical protein
VNEKSEKRERGGFVLTFEPGRAERIDAALRYRQHEATETFSSVDWKFYPKELVCLSFSFGHDVGVRDRTLDGVVLMERMKTFGATGKLKMRLNSPVMFDEPIEFKELPPTLSRGLALSTSIDLHRIDPSAWQKLLDHMQGLRPADAAAIEQLVKSQFDDRRIFAINERTERLMEQRDAIGTAIEIAGLDRARVLQTLDASKVGSANSALDLLDSEPLQEQDALRFDHAAFGALLTQGMRHAQFRSDGGAQVRVHIYDRKKLESWLGIDLLIYLELYRAYILVQYKMMKKGEREDGGWYYLVDDHLRTQLSLMNNAATQMQSASMSPLPMGDWRLSEEVFFWKFCETTRRSDTEGSLVHGMTLPRPHLESFLQLTESEGKSGGRRIGYENCRRYLTNTQFADLAQGGWIGGGAGARTVMEDLLKANQREGRQTILTVVARARNLKQIRRRW